MTSVWLGAAVLAHVVGCADNVGQALPLPGETGRGYDPPDPTATTPRILDKHLTIRTVVSGLVQPTSIAFLGNDDLFVLQKGSGQVWRVTNGVRGETPVLDLAVNSVGGRGLMGIALHPRFATNPYVYLYWTESSTALDTTVATETPMLGSRIDRFVWNGSNLTYDLTLMRVRAADSLRPAPGLYGGVLTFGLDGKLYGVIGDVNVRGALQNLECGPPLPMRDPSDCSDSTYGEDGADPVDHRLTGVIVRFDPDGSVPSDNPFYAVGANIGGTVGANIQKIYAYGIRNSFGMAVDPVTGALWATDNADDTFDEINLIEPGMNSGWLQFFGPVSRVAEFKAMESTFGAANIFGDTRWLPSHIADTPEEALERLYMLPGAHYSDPEFSWKWAVPPAAIGFAGSGLGEHYRGDLFVGGATGGLYGGHLFRFDFVGSRKGRKMNFLDERLYDGVADNNGKNDITESESLLIGTNFGTLTDIETSPSGSLYLVSLTRGAIYEIKARSEPGLPVR